MRKQLIDFFIWFRNNGEKHIGESIERMVDIYLSEREEKDNQRKKESGKCQSCQGYGCEPDLSTCVECGGTGKAPVNSG